MLLVVIPSYFRSAGCIVSPACGERGSGNSGRSAVLPWNVIIVNVVYKIATSLAITPQACICACTCRLNLIITFLWMRTSMSCDHYNPITCTFLQAIRQSARPSLRCSTSCTAKVGGCGTQTRHVATIAAY